MKDFMGSKTTYYSLAKNKLKGKHPRIYNLILIFTLLSLTGTAAFLISDILSTAKDSAQEKEPTLSVLDANSSPSDGISSQSTANSTEMDELGKETIEQNSSQNSSIAAQSRGSTNSSKQAGSSTSSSKSSSGSSGSSSSSRSSSSQEKKAEDNAEEKADVPKDESANLTATNQTSTAQLPGNSSLTLHALNDAAATEQQLKKLTAKVYRNESPQIAVGQEGRDDSNSRFELLTSETGAAEMTPDLNIQADNKESAEAETNIKIETPDRAETPAQQETTGKTEEPTKGEMPNEAEISPNPETMVKTESPENAGTQTKTEATFELEATNDNEKPVKTDTTAKTETSAEDEMHAESSGVEGSVSAKVNERQESRSKQMKELAREKAEHNMGAAIERAQSYSFIERERTEMSESAGKASLMALQRSTKLQESRSEKGEDAAERIERNDAAISAKALAAPSISKEDDRASLPSKTDAASLSKASASISRAQAQKELRSSRSEQSEKMADLRADRTNAAAASKASATALRARDLSERTEAKEKALKTAISAADARKSKLQESRSGSAVE